MFPREHELFNRLPGGEAAESAWPGSVGRDGQVGLDREVSELSIVDG